MCMLALGAAMSTMARILLARKKAFHIPTAMPTKKPHNRVSLGRTNKSRQRNAKIKAAIFNVIAN